MALRTLRVASQKRNLVYNPPVRDMKFLFNDVLEMYPHYAACPEPVPEECTEDFVDSVVDASVQLAETVTPTYQTGDVGCVFKDGEVTTPKGFKECYDLYSEGGWQGLSLPSEYGGMGMPLSVSLLKNEILATANWAWFMYPGLSLGAANTILYHGTSEMKETYLPKIIEGTWTGSMCLTEPHCGTDLAQIKTKAVDGPNGSYKITGTKIFISGGEQDLTENIVHIVLAKLPGAPEGTKGISLFLVPKYLMKPDGSLETKKNVVCGSIEKKMGIHGCSTAQLHFEDSIGWLIGEPHDGLRQMFTFMNTARIGTAMQGVTHMELAFQNAAIYANDRMSMRSLSGKKERENVADAIVHHGDVRKNLMIMKALLEGSRCLLYDVAKFGDKITYAILAGDTEKEKRLEDEMGFLTPVAKGCVTEWGLECANLGVQIYGGHGYIKDHGMEQIVRDARIATLYEGTTGIQALDMLGRKMMLDKLRMFKKWNSKITKFALASMSSPHKAEAMKLFMLAMQWKVQVIRMGYQATKNRDMVSSASVDHLFFSGYIFLGYYWLKMGIAAERQLRTAETEADKKFYRNKVATMKFYFDYLINRAESHKINMVRPPKSIYGIPKEDLAI
eukprot:TRINITY_DN714_c8_g1_i1.p1 TRINITY_DN714_c8_g1~~TRINITY_DN714_c8_g1_i1.p1  ORF type:complete len:617 (+),score=149.37 TRINITY_DN714_c8_g1_i1:74-1924(+)